MTSYKSENDGLDLTPTSFVGYNVFIGSNKHPIKKLIG